MRFSLKDLMWTVTLSSVGMLCVVLSTNVPGGPTAFIYQLPLILLPGALFGASIGKLVHSTMKGAMLGFLWWYALLLLVAVAYQAIS